MLQGWIFEVKADRLIVGERIKMGIFRPCVHTIPCSTISHSLKDATGIDGIYATGFLVEDENNRFLNRMERVVIAGRDAATNGVRMHITVEFLSNVVANVVVLKTQRVQDPGQIIDNIPTGRFVMGGLRSKGFGDCAISLLRPVNGEDAEPTQGKLNTRIYEDWSHLFGIECKRENFGYLYRPDPMDPYGKPGAYHKALFDGSWVEGPNILIRQ